MILNNCQSVTWIDVTHDEDSVMGQKQRHVVFQGASKLENSTIRAIAVEFVYSLKTR